jgi:autotransporter-associated beta strand protein
LYANPISGNGGFGIQGHFQAQTTLTAANTYTGGTGVSSGKLFVNNLTGSGTGPGFVDVAFQGTLGGTGTIAGAVTVRDSGTIAPGNSIGTLTLLDDLMMGNNSRLAIEVSGTTSDLLAIGGDLDLSGNDRLLVTGTGTGPWLIATYGGMLTGTFNTAPAGYVVDYSLPGQVLLNKIALSGDYNADGIVDAADYVLWRKHPEALSGESAGYVAWRVGFGAGQSGGLGQGSKVPEPTYGWAILVAISAMSILSRRRTEVFAKMPWRLVS